MNAVLPEPLFVGQYYGECSGLEWIVGLCFCQGIKEHGTFGGCSPLFFWFVRPFSSPEASGWT